MTLRERLALARDCRTHSGPFVLDNSKREAKMVRFEKVKARTNALKQKPK